MAKKKISPKVQHAAEKYLDSLGSSQEQLSNKQWDVIANYVKAQRMVVPILLVFGIIFAGLSFWAFQFGKRGVTSVIPNEVNDVIFVCKSGEESTKTVKADDIRDYMGHVTVAYWHSGSSFVLAVLFLTSIFIMVPLNRRGTKKMLKAFIPRKQELENRLEK